MRQDPRERDSDTAAHRGTAPATEDEYGPIPDSNMVAACEAAIADRHASKSTRAWAALGMPLSLLCGHMWQVVRRRNAHLNCTRNFHAEPDPVLRLHSDREALKYVAGWVLMKVTWCHKVQSDRALIAVMDHLAGPLLPNSNNFALLLYEMKHSSLHSAVDALNQFMTGLAQTCTAYLTKDALFGGRQKAFTNIMHKLECDCWLWEFWLGKLTEAVVHVGSESTNGVSHASSHIAIGTPTLTHTHARILHGLVVERYMHQRQKAELERRKATADMETQVCVRLFLSIRLAAVPTPLEL